MNETINKLWEHSRKECPDCGRSIYPMISFQTHRMDWGDGSERELPYHVEIENECDDCGWVDGFGTAVVQRGASND